MPSASTAPPPHRRVRAAGRPGERARERGSGSVWVLNLCVLVWFTALAVVLVAGVRADHHRAASAADLAALAGAERAALGAASACAAARSTAEANGATLTDCDLADDLSLRVTVRTPARLVRGTVTAHSRAGPAGAHPLPATQ
ncbi:flp pilus-assembly TadE/G-like family protein [Streptomonospora sp. S1-112]|uniref:Flp pilus-assembly TadE/G-like family protein n=1 Tax=Streptomonospora mangrovi TaxID=2883123 RepID=A0A9X3NTC6_9ACTN|nr:Rv3654c family TadE-like protein [Streptomonospora mangrovi]MDA0566495.1 flp pilus-assembly TadE/G-like family protein [Streptomonospora mangrovi]